MENNNKTITRISTDHAGIRLNKELTPGKSYEWTIKLESIGNSQWIAVGVGEITATRYDKMYGISSQNQIYPSRETGYFSGDWQSGDIIHITYKNNQVVIKNTNTTKGHKVPVPSTNVLYPFFDIHQQGLSISIVDFKTIS